MCWCRFIFPFQITDVAVYYSVLYNNNETNNVCTLIINKIRRYFIPCLPIRIFDRRIHVCRDRLRVFVIVEIYDDLGGFTSIIFITSILQTGIVACPHVSSYFYANSRIRRINNLIAGWCTLRVRVNAIRLGFTIKTSKQTRVKNRNSNIDLIVAISQYIVTFCRSKFGVERADNFI